MDTISRGKPKTRAGKIVGRILCVILVTLLLVCAFVYGVIWVVCRGPSETARNLFVRSVRETSAIGFLADLVLSQDEIAQIMARQETAPIEMDTSRIEIAAPEESASGPKPDAWGFLDEDGDGLILVPVAGRGYTGYMLIVLNPKRVVLGCIPERFGTNGYTVASFAERFGAVAAINGGGFKDEGGLGDGSMPEFLVVRDGVLYNTAHGVGSGFIGIDDEGILHVEITTLAEVTEKHIMQGVGYGPILVANGEMIHGLESGLNPRTAIGQRADGAILMLVIDGRRATSLGASYWDLAQQMLAFGAVNAGNLDGGSSSLLWLNGEYVNNTAAVVGVRTIPTCFLVMPEDG